MLLRIAEEAAGAFESWVGHGDTVEWSAGDCVGVAPSERDSTYRVVRLASCVTRRLHRETHDA